MTHWPPKRLEPARLAMGARGYLAHLLYLKGQTSTGPPQSNQAGLNI
jgi:hypothetical protein